MTSTTRRTLESLSKLRLPELQARFAEIVGEATRSPNKTFLLRRIGEAPKPASGRRTRSRRHWPPQRRRARR